MNEQFQRNIANTVRYANGLVIVLIVFVAILSVNALKSFGYIGESEDASDTIVVSGEGEAFAVPDVAVFTYAVEEEANTVAQAQESVSEKWNEILEYLEGEGVDEEDVKTVGFNVSPVYASERDHVFRRPDVAREIVGYRVRQRAEVKVRDTSNVGAILSGVGERDVQNISNLSLRIEDEEEIKQEARAEAIEQARGKAETLASALGVQLDGVAGFRESGVSPYMPYARDAAFLEAQDAGVSSEIPMGENRIVVNVEVTYRIR